VKSFTDSIKGGGGLLSQMEKIREQEAMTRTTKLDNPAKFTTPAQFFRTSEMGFESAASYKQMYQQPVKDIQNSSPYIKQKIAGRNILIPSPIASMSAEGLRSPVWRAVAGRMRLTGRPIGIGGWARKLGQYDYHNLQSIYWTKHLPARQKSNQ
jgi:hypothetical protein